MMEMAKQTGPPNKRDPEHLGRAYLANANNNLSKLYRYRGTLINKLPNVRQADRRFRSGPSGNTITGLEIGGSHQ